MIRPGRASAVALVLLGLLVVAVAALHPASAARLHVTAAPLQTWEVTDLPGMPPAPEPIELSACGDLDDYDEVVYGTSGDDELVAGNGRQVLVGLAGDDVLIGGNHDDCLVGGLGDDRLDGGNGRDVLLGELGADLLDGGTGKDLLDAGGDPGDSCTSNGAPDVLVGCGSSPAAATDELSTPLAPDVDDSAPDGQGEEPKSEPSEESSHEPTEEPTSEPSGGPPAEGVPGDEAPVSEQTAAASAS